MSYPNFFVIGGYFFRKTVDFTIMILQQVDIFKLFLTVLMIGINCESIIHKLVSTCLVRGNEKIYKTCSCRAVRCSGTLFWDENLLLVQNRFVLSLPVKKVNDNKFSSHNFVISSQNNVQDDMNKFVD